MKKFLVLMIALFGAASLYAQDAASVKAKYDEGAAAYGAKNFEGAAAAFQAVITEGMDVDGADGSVTAAKQMLPRCYFQLGGRAFKAAKYDEAIAQFQKMADAADLYGDNANLNKAKMWIGNTYQKQGGDAFNAKDYATAAEIFAKGYEANPKNAEMANWLGTCYCETGRYAEGFAVLKKVAANRNPKYADDVAEANRLLDMYTNNMIAGYQQKGDNDGLIAVAEKMLAEDPADDLALKIRVEAYNGKKDWSKVIELAPAAAEAQQNPDNKSYIYYLQGVAYNAKEMKPQAIAALSKVTSGASVEPAKAALAELKK